LTGFFFLPTPMKKKKQAIKKFDWLKIAKKARIPQILIDRSFSEFIKKLEDILNYAKNLQQIQRKKLEKIFF
jgi:hypothetical protein